MPSTRHALMCLCIVFIFAQCQNVSCASDSITLDDALKYAFSNNPGLAAFYWRHQASLEECAAARAQPNPQIVLSCVNGKAPDDSNSLVQTFELFGRPQIRERVAISGAQIKEAQYALQERVLARDVTIAFVDALKNRSLREVAEEQKKLSQEALAVAEKRYEVGDVPLMQVMQFRIELKKAEGALDTATLEEKNSLIALNRLMGLPFKSEFTLSGDDMWVMEGSLPEEGLMR